jgi:acetoin utilization protein AcuC
VEHPDAERAQPLVVFGASSLHYDFGTQHPLTPRRFGPGIDLLRALGADRFLPPREVSDAQLQRVHDPEYVSTVRMLSEYPDVGPMAGFASWGDDPPFYGMHQAAATVAGGSVGAMERILTGEDVHVFHPGGGLHHAMPGRASGFCIYNDVALAIGRARDVGHRVLYVDLDVHHGDGVEAIFWNDPQVLTVSFHETGLSLFPGTGFAEDCGGPQARGTAVNVPFEPGTSDASWFEAVEMILPALAAAYRPTMLVTQHGSDSHMLDPLAHMQLSTTAMSRAARLLDGLAHEHAAGRWLATGGGGYDVYRVVPRAWGLVWLAQAHRDVPAATPAEWRSRWAAEAARHGQGPPPDTMLDPPDVVSVEPRQVVDRNLATARTALKSTLRALEEWNAA